MTLEEAIIEKLRELPPEKQQEILNFADFLVQKAQTEHRTAQINWQPDPCLGMWKDRLDMQDSTSWVWQLPQQK